MNISSLQQMQPLLLSFEQQEVSQNNQATPFADIFQTAFQDATQKEKELEQSQYLLAIGEVEDAHTVPIAAAQAQLSVDLMVQLRNKAVDAYNELMRISM